MYAVTFMDRVTDRVTYGIAAPDPQSDKSRTIDDNKVNDHLRNNGLLMHKMIPLGL